MATLRYQAGSLDNMEPEEQTKLMNQMVETPKLYSKGDQAKFWKDLALEALAYNVRMDENAERINCRVQARDIALEMVEVKPDTPLAGAAKLVSEVDKAIRLRQKTALLRSLIENYYKSVDAEQVKEEQQEQVKEDLEESKPEQEEQEDLPPHTD